MKNKEKIREINLVELLQALWAKGWSIIGFMVLFGAIGFLIARFFVTPLYQADVLMYVNNSSLSVGSTKVSISSSDLSAAQSLVDTYVVILNTRTTLNDVIQKSGVDYTCEELQQMISASAVNSTEVFKIVVTSPSPGEAKKIANTIAQVLPNRISNVVEGSSARVVDDAVTPIRKASPSISRYTAVGIFIGFLLRSIVIILREMFDERIHDEDTLLEMYEGIPVLAVIPELRQAAEHRNGYGYGYGYGYQSRNSSGSRERTVK